jgi:hypothetical protein
MMMQLESGNDRDPSRLTCPSGRGRLRPALAAGLLFLATLCPVTLAQVVGRPPVITTGPQSQSVLAGSNVTFTIKVAPSATGLSYQWSYDGEALGGANGADLTLPNVTVSQAGTYAVTVKNAAGSVSTNATLTVSLATPTTTWNNPAPIVYGTALGANQLSAAANVPGSFAYNPAFGTVLNAGTATLTVVFTPSDTADYAPATNTVSLAVLPAPLTVTAANKSRPYGAANPFFGGTITGLQNGDSISAFYSSAATISSPVGTYSIVPGLVDRDNRLVNYTVTLVNGTLTVTPVPLTITANNQSITYGAVLPPLTVAYSGFVNGDSSFSLATQPTVTTTATAASPVGAYPITATGAADANYTISYVPGTLNIYAPFQLLPLPPAGGLFTLRLVGPPSQAFVLQASTDVLNWQPILTNVMTTNGTFDFPDPDSALFNQRFYRGVIP